MEMQGENEISPFRIVTIGDESVGKTSIIVRLVENRFNPHEAGTIGANYQVYNQFIEGAKIEFQIWDTAGQEKFRSLAPVYYRNAAAAIVVFSLTNRQSFLSLKSEIETFYNVAGASAFVFVAANKSDLDDDYQVTFEEAEEWANAHSYHLFMTSAKSGEGISQMFRELANELYKLNQHRVVATVNKSNFLQQESQKKSCC